MLRRGLLALVVVTVLGATGVVASAAQAAIMNVYGTSDISDSNLMAKLIKPGFETYSAERGTKWEIEYHSSGTTQALEEAAKPEKEASAVLVHAISAEREWVEKGNSYHTNEWGYALFYNDFIVLGPTGDPAEVGTGTSATEAKAAFKKIALAGKAGKATFVSRGDASGTNIKEQEIWQEIRAELEPEIKFTTVVAGTRAKPTPSENPWYKETGLKQGANLEKTNKCNEAGWTPKSCYTIVDRGSYYNVKAGGETGNLKIVTQEPSPPTGELTNVFRGYIPLHTPNVAASEELYAYLQSEAFQTSLLGFIGPEEHSFLPNAAPSLKTASFSKENPRKGSKIEVTAKFVYAPPIPPTGELKPFVGVETELFKQPNCVGPFVTTGLTGTTNPSGIVTFKPTVGIGTSECFEIKSKPLTVSAVPFESQFGGSTYTKIGAKNGKVVLT